MYGALSDERIGLSFITVIVSSNVSCQNAQYLYFTCCYVFLKEYVCIKYTQGLCQSRLSTAVYALLLIAPASTAV
jgi:hypothetical protein